jgi:inositol phosphorylceramide synthase catalytic subunit
MSRLWLRARQMWPGWSIHLPLLLVYWCFVMGALGELHGDHVAIAVGVLALALWSPRTKRFLKAFVGFVFVAWLYDASRFIRTWGVSQQRTLLCTLHRAEVSLFGVTADGQRQTLQDYFQVHHWLGADLFFAVPYGVFLLIAALYAVYLYRQDPRACARYSWAFGILNVLGIITYHVVPAAPPWYFHKFGCAVDLFARSYEGAALARVDAFLGIPYFRNFYGRASEVYGAIPSLHVAYPLLIVFYGWRRHGAFGRALSIFYSLWMCAAAVYLDHHWITDIVLGWAYAVAVVGAMDELPALRALFAPRWASQTPAGLPGGAVPKRFFPPRPKANSDEKARHP